jgi:hypothetical protein
LTRINTGTKKLQPRIDTNPAKRDEFERAGEWEGQLVAEIEVLYRAERRRYGHGMLCEICQTRYANVHETRLDVTQGNETRTQRHLCEVCSRIKNEQQMVEEEKARQAASEQRWEQVVALGREINKSLFEPRLDDMLSKQVRTRGRSLDPHWKLALCGVISFLPGVNPVEVVLGPSGAGKNHAVQMVGDCEVHLIHWHPDPKQCLDRLFEVFPQAGASLDLENRLVIVKAERELFPDPYRSLSFCALATWLISAGMPGERFRFRPKITEC